MENELDKNCTADMYSVMQKMYYDNPATSVESVVGNYEYHESVPYESLLLYKNHDVRFPIFSSFSDKIAFDICCGEGRMIRRMSKIFKRVDGCDISTKMLSAAKERCQDSLLYLKNGQNCGNAEKGIYDFIYCTISLQHISSYTIRSSIISNAVSLLNKEGKMSLQLLYSKNYPYIFSDRIVRTGGDFLLEIYTKDTKHVSYFEDKFDAKSTNSGCDSLIGENDIVAVLHDFSKYFKHLSVWFYDISIGRETVFKNNHPNSHSKRNYQGTHFIIIHGEFPHD
jgi:2-polyprenyl-3-methyl-5-hydroxy-6-metoxy-1,4-benzoquinol methylase